MTWSTFSYDSLVNADNFKEEERSKIALAATTKALVDASKADFEMNLDLKDVKNRSTKRAGPKRFFSTFNSHEKINVLFRLMLLSQYTDLVVIVMVFLVIGRRFAFYHFL